jgi:putative endonuclease
MYFVYALSSLSRDYIYVGISDDVDRRFSQHNAGYEKTTKPYRPFKLIYKEQFSSRPEARKREKYLKSGSGKEFLKSLLVSQA